MVQFFSRCEPPGLNSCVESPEPPDLEDFKKCGKELVVHGPGPPLEVGCALND